MQRHDSIEIYSECRCVYAYNDIHPTELYVSKPGDWCDWLSSLVEDQHLQGVICLPHRRHLALGGVISPHTQPAEGAQTRSSLMLCGVKPSSQIQRQLTTECLWLPDFSY